MQKLIKFIIYFFYLTVAALILGECCLRIFGVYGDEGNIKIDHHNLLGWILKPNQTGIDTNIEWKVK